MKKLLTCIFSFCVLTSWSQSEADKVLEMINIINFAYVDSVDGQKLSEAAIVAMLESLDPHSMYIPKDQVKAMNESLKGSFEGVGIQFDIYDDTVTVVTAIPGGPSAELGILSGDQIIMADGKTLSGIGITDEKVITELRGKKGTEVTMVIRRKGVDDGMIFKIVRDKIPLKSVDVAYILDDQTGYIRINRFAKTTYDEFIGPVKEFKEMGMSNLIIDLRGNGGGYLHSAVDVADELLDSKELIVYTRGMRQADRNYHAKPKGAFTEGKLVVLIDEGSASASEILAGAIQDSDRGVIIGRRSFGKGLVMKPYSLSDGSMVRLTTARYYTPSGRCIQKEYGTSKEAYDHELMDRFENGEYYSLESLDLPEDLKFETRIGRPVYGGGGIIPDIFVSADTLVLSETYQKILKSQSITKFTLDYVKNNRDALNEKYKDVNELIKDGAMTEVLIDQYSEYAIQSDIISEYVHVDLRPTLGVQIKASLARHLWDDSSYYRVLTSDQRIIKKAQFVLGDEEFDWETLSFHSN